MRRTASSTQWIYILLLLTTQIWGLLFPPSRTKCTRIKRAVHFHLTCAEVEEHMKWKQWVGGATRTGEDGTALMLILYLLGPVLMIDRCTFIGVHRWRWNITHCAFTVHQLCYSYATKWGLKWVCLLPPTSHHGRDLNLRIYVTL